MDDSTAAPWPDPQTLAKRFTQRRHALGLTENDVATRAGMAPAYLKHLLVMTPDFDPAGLVRVAAALELSVQELLHGARRPAPGQGTAGPSPVLASLTEAECWKLVGHHGVGRVALVADDVPVVLPVNYTVHAHTVAYRTRPGGAAAPHSGQTVSFEVDRIDDRVGRGWSVLVTGTAEPVEDEQTAARLDESAAGQPWAGGARPLWVRVAPASVTGRRIETAPGGGAAPVPGSAAAGERPGRGSGRAG